MSGKESGRTGGGAPKQERIAPKQERIAKVIARAGVCSRREAERLIAEGRVTLKGEVLTSPAVTVPNGRDIKVDGRSLPRPQHARLFRYHKPRGRITSTSDPENRPTIYDDLPPGLPRLQPVGRLDIASEGLLLLTNDGELKRHLELPATGLERCYRVRVYGEVSEARLAALAEGVTVDGMTYEPIQAELERQSGTNSWLVMTLKEGKNREIRRVCEHLGLRVNRLQRLAYGPFELADLKPGAIREVPESQLAARLGFGQETPARGRRGKKRGARGKTPGTKTRGKAEGADRRRQP